MGMTREEKISKDFIQTLLSSQGYPTYANIFSNFDLNLTDNPNIVGFMEPSKGRIVINRNLNKDQVSVIIRHEILHQFLDHENRLVKKIARKFGLDPDNLTLDELENVKKEIYKNKNFNIAGDYEISNRGYTDEDKENVRNIELNGQILRGLVTEDDHPDWVDYTLEDMYDELNKPKEDQQNKDNSNDKNDSSSDEDDQQNNSSKSQQSNSTDSSDSGSDQDNQTDDSSDSEEDDDSSEDDDTSSSSSSNSSQSTDDEKPQKKKRGRKKKQQDDTDNKESSTPEIGDMGDADDLAKEDAEREQQIKQEKEEEQDYSSNDEITSGDVDSSGSGDRSVDSEQSRLERIKKILQDKEIADQISDETDTQVSRSRSATAERNAKKYRNTPINKFTDSLNRFIKNEVGDSRNSTWRRFNKSYVGTGIMRPGHATVKNKNIPLINVYFDRSGSWDAAKTAVGEQAIGTLNNYVRKKQIKIQLYYFANKVSEYDDYNSLGGYGTSGQPILDHIKQTKPDNVIIMTDDDIFDCRTSVEVPGAVWFLWKGGVSQNLQQHLKGAKETNNYNLD